MVCKYELLDILQSLYKNGLPGCHAMQFERYVLIFSKTLLTPPSRYRGVPIHQSITLNNPADHNLYIHCHSTVPLHSTQHMGEWYYSFTHP
jgi:hypothetical protein